LLAILTYLISFCSVFLAFRFAIGAVGDFCPHLPTVWKFFSHTSESFVKDPTMTVSCSPGIVLPSNRDLTEIIAEGKWVEQYFMLLN
jgi:hypothetical protein